MYRSHKKREESLEGGLDRILFAAELEFLKIMVPKLTQDTTNVNNDCAGKLRPIRSVISWLEQWYIYFYEGTKMEEQHCLSYYFW